MFQADDVQIRLLVDNWVDMLLPDAHVHTGICQVDVERWGLVEHFDPRLLPPQAENGISLLVKVTKDRRSTNILFDAGLTGTVLRHNLHAFNEDPASIDCLVLSHGHPDHYGGVYEFLNMTEHRVPVVTHTDAFLPRFAMMGGGRSSTFYNARLDSADIEESGGRIVTTREPVELGWGVRTSGEIPRATAYEGTPEPGAIGAPGLYQIRQDGRFVVDQVTDEQALIIDVRDRGLVVITGCGHAGAVNTVAKAVALYEGKRPVAALIGGCHLGFPTTPTENIARTIVALQEVGVGCVMPMHCSGLAAVAAFREAFGQGFIQPSIGTVVRIGDRSTSEV